MFRMTLFLTTSLNHPGLALEQSIISKMADSGDTPEYNSKRFGEGFWWCKALPKWVLLDSQVPNKRVGWKKCKQGNIQKKTDKETEKSNYNSHPTCTFSTLLVYLAPKSMPGSCRLFQSVNNFGNIFYLKEKWPGYASFFLDRICCQSF